MRYCTKSDIKFHSFKKIKKEKQRVKNAEKYDLICKYSRNTGMALCKVSATRDEL